MTPEDARIWKLVKDQPRTREQWVALHNAIEDYRRMVIADYKRLAPREQTPGEGATT